MLSLNPSQSEQMHLIGRKVDDFKELYTTGEKEVFQKLEAFTRSAMDEYALNFGRDNIREARISCITHVWKRNDPIIRKMKR